MVLTCGVTSAAHRAAVSRSGASSATATGAGLLTATPSTLRSHRVRYCLPVLAARPPGPARGRLGHGPRGPARDRRRPGRPRGRPAPPPIPARRARTPTATAGHLALDRTTHR